MNPAILALLNVALPETILLIKEKFAKQNPDAPPVTDEMVHAAMLNWLAGTLAKDDSFLAGG
jgi:hypothetical protein